MSLERLHHGEMRLLRGRSSAHSQASLHPASTSSIRLPDGSSPYTRRSSCNHLQRRRDNERNRSGLLRLNIRLGRMQSQLAERQVDNETKRLCYPPPSDAHHGAIAKVGALKGATDDLVQIDDFNDCPGGTGFARDRSNILTKQ